MLLSQNKIAGVSRLLAASLRMRVSPETIGMQLQLAISGSYSPHSGWSDREYDIAFLVKAIGGPRLLYAMQQVEGYPSLSTLRRRKPIPELVVSPGIPNAMEMKSNISSFLGVKERPPPKSKMVGQVVVVDGVALEELARFDLKRNNVIGLCREHSDQVKKSVDTIADIQTIGTALHNDKITHYGKDGTVVGIAPVTGDEHYYVVPLVLSASCKTEIGEDLAKWLDTFITAYCESPDGEERHGPIVAIATDGESSFRKMRFSLGLTEDLDVNSSLGRILYHLPGFNCKTGKNQILGTCDPKHIVKRFATMLRSPTGIQVSDTLITATQIMQVLTHLDNMTPEKASLLLDPADKQNVPKAVNLLQSLFDLDKLDIVATPVLVKRFRYIRFISRVLNYFLQPFIKVEMSLSHQLRDLSTYAHLITALYQKHKLSFLTGALLADSQAIVKNIYFTTARLQILDPALRYYILFEGTDRLEGLFSNVRTQDHAPNFDILQLSHKLSVATEINAIFERHPDLDRGHIRRNLIDARGVDHINPKSWTGDVTVGNVAIAHEYLAGRDQANKLLIDYLGEEEKVDFDDLFSKPDYDHLRPGGKYVGHREFEQTENDDGVASGGLYPNFESHSSRDTADALEDTRDSIDHAVHNNPEYIAEELNPSPELDNSHYLIVDGKHRGKPELVAQYLGGFNTARKVTNRPLRAGGLSKEAALRRSHTQLLNPDDNEDNDEGKVKTGDPGAILVRVGKIICLAVAEALNFRQGLGSHTKNLTTIDIDDLDANPGSNKAIMITIQILDLLDYNELNPGHGGDSEDGALPGNFTWAWSQQYIRILESRNDSEVMTKQQFVTCVPGRLFYPVAAGVDVHPNRNLIWSIQNSDLVDIMETAWSAMNPDSSEILNNIKMLPKVTGPGLPYMLKKKTPQLCRTDFTIDDEPEKLKARDKVACRLCIKVFALKDMRKHVGFHILHHARRDCNDETLTEGVEVRDLHSCGKFKATYNLNADRAKPLWMVWIGRMLDTTHPGDRKAGQNHVQLQISLCEYGILKGT